MMKTIESAEDPGVEYIEIDGLRMIIKNGLFVGIYDPRLDEVLD